MRTILLSPTRPDEAFLIDLRLTTIGNCRRSLITPIDIGEFPADSLGRVDEHPQTGLGRQSSNAS